MTNAREVLKGISVRIENRPTVDDVERMRRFLRQTGVRAWVSSAVGVNRGTEYHGSALYRSQVAGFEMHPDANPEYLPRLVKMVHEEGIVLLSWLPLTHVWAGGYNHIHPEWRYQTIPENKGVPSLHYCLLSTDYLDFISRICREIVTTVGFDGMWFDGTGIIEMYGTPPGTFGCACPGCRTNFKQDTGREFPVRWDWSDGSFRAFVRWAYQRKNWALQELTKKILSARPDAAVFFNHSAAGPEPNGGQFTDWRVNMPLEVNSVIGASRGDEAPDQGMNALLHARLGAAACPGEFDVWRPLQSMALPWNSALEPPLEENLLHTFAQIAHGGTAFLGIHRLEENYVSVLTKVIQEAEKREPWRGGTAQKHLAIHLSQASRDFGGQDDPSTYLKPWFGAYELAADSGVPLSIVLDSQLTRESLSEVRVLFLPESTCLSNLQAQQIEDFVRTGGTLVATGLTGIFDEEGQSRPTGILDNLLGIERAQNSGMKWMIVGPFDNTDSKGFDTVYGPEKGPVNLDAEYPGAGGRNVRWKPYPEPGNYVHFLDQFSLKEWVCAYAYTTIQSETDSEVKFLVASDDGCKIWVNGRLVHSIFRLRGVYEEQDVVPVHLKQGENQILVKVEQRYWDWGLILEIVEKDAAPKPSKPPFCPVCPVDKDIRNTVGPWVWLGDKTFPFSVRQDSGAKIAAYFLKDDSEPNYVDFKNPETSRGEKPAVSICRSGKGEAIYIGADLGICQVQRPGQNQLNYFRSLITRNGVPVSIKGPTSVELSVFWKENKLICHLLNRPLTSTRPILSENFKPFLSSPPLSAEVELILNCNGRPAKAFLPLRNQALEFSVGVHPNSWIARICVERHEIVVIEEPRLTGVAGVY